MTIKPTAISLARDPSPTAAPVQTRSCFSLFTRLCVMRQLGKKAGKAESYIHKLFYNDLQSRVAWLPPCTSPSGFLATIDYTTDQLEALTADATAQVNQLIDQLENQPAKDLIPQADIVYRRCMQSLADMEKRLAMTKVQRAHYAGQLTTIFKRLDDAFSGDDTLHRYCGCHIKTEQDDGGLKKLAPGIKESDALIDHPRAIVRNGLPKNTSAVVLTQRYGKGHDGAQEAMSQRLAECGAHAYKLDASDEVLEVFYNYRKWTGSSGVEWSEWCLKNNHVKIMRFLGWLSSGRDSLSTREKKAVCFALALLSRGVQDVAITCFQRGTAPLLIATNRLGQGTLETATDPDYIAYDMQRDIENPHFKHGMMVRDPEQEKLRLTKSLYPEQLAEIGFPVRNAFLKRYTDTEKQALREKHQIAPDESVVILLSGGIGFPNTISETLVEKYPNEAPKICLFVICGKNQEREQALIHYFQTINHPKLRATSLGWTPEDVMGELFAIGALLISPKPGGGTVAEAAASGIPILVSERSGMVHEQENLNFIERHRLGVRFDKEEEVPQKVIEMLSNPLKPLLAPNGEVFSDYNSKEKSLGVIGQIVRASRADTSFALRKSVMMGPLPKAAREPASKIVQLCQNYGWQKLSDPQHQPFLTFLYTARLFFPIRGYEVALQHHPDLEMRHGIKMIDGKPHILKEGTWISGDQVLAEFSYRSSTGITLNGAPWQYSYPQGLVPVQPNQISPAYHLSEAELDGLYEHSKNYFAEEARDSIPKAECGYVQIITDENGIGNRIGSHVTVRLIDNTGALYSIGFERPLKDHAHMGFLSLFSSFNGVLNARDYKEFRQFDDTRHVTTVPVNLETFQRVFSKVKGYAAQPLAHNFLTQNCVLFAGDILQEAGVSIDLHTTSGTSYLFHAIAPAWMRKITHAVQRAFDCIPKWITKPISFIVTCLTFVPGLILTLLKNLFFVALGAGQSAVLLQATEGPGRFSASQAPFRHWTHFFKDFLITPTYKVMDWQEEQTTTRAYRYEGPKLYGI